MNTTESLVRNEVQLNVSHILQVLKSVHVSHTGDGDGDGIAALALERAHSMFDPIYSYARAADEADLDIWALGGGGGYYACNVQNDAGRWLTQSHYNSLEEASKAACTHLGIDAQEVAVYEYWAVSDHFADKLVAEGEKVEREFLGMNVWCRTTIGQAIWLDAVIKKIAATKPRCID